MRRGRPTYVLGTGLSHDGSACLLEDGEILVAIEKERLTRRKHDGGNDCDAIQYCLRAANIALDQVDVVVQNANFSMFERGNDWFQGPRLVADHPHVVTISHHLAHAYSAIGTGPFDSAAVLVIDGCGNSYDECTDRTAGFSLAPPHDPALDHLHFEKDSYYRFDGRTVSTIAKDYSPWGYRVRDYPMCPPTTLHSIGGMYQAASNYCLGGIDDAGKLMGLAPYGKRGVFGDEIFELKDGRVSVNYEWMSRFDRPRRRAEDFTNNFQYYADIAAWVQSEVERALLYLINHRFDLFASKNLAYSGGVALNAVANRRILRESRFQNVYIQPAAGDNGLAIGCAYYGWLAVLQRERRIHNGSSAFGRRYTREETAAALAAHQAQVVATESADIANDVAELLDRGQIIGWFEGKSEFGPRALGHRSILADPRQPGVRDKINAHVKFREDFRPFAPAVLEERASEYFASETSSPYMLLVAPVREEFADSIRAVVHLDGSARLQTVSASTEPAFHALLSAFERRTGLPILLNTSFNRRGMPIVETPADALGFFLECALDVLVIDTFIVRKRQAAAAPIRDSRILEALRKLEGAIDAVRKTAGTLELVFELRLTGAGAYTMALSKDHPALSANAPQSAHAVLEAAPSDLISVMNDPNLAAALFADGRLRLRGNPQHLPTLLSILRHSPR